MTSKHTNKSIKKGGRTQRSSFFSNHKRLWLVGGAFALLYIFGFYYFFVSPTGFRWRALFGEMIFPSGYEIHGIDVSHYQGRINWKKLKGGNIDGCPVRFVVIKATEGRTLVDKRFRENFSEAREHGFIRGAYHFWSIKSSPAEQAYFFLDKVKLDRGDLPPVLDIERRDEQQSVEEFQRDILTWLHIVEDRYHVKPIIYTNHKFKQLYLSAPVFDDYPYWIAHYYVKEVQYTGEWKFWQHTDNGRLPGIRGPVDFNIYNGSYYDLQNLCIK